MKKKVGNSFVGTTSDGQGVIRDLVEHYLHGDDRLHQKRILASQDA